MNDPRANSHLVAWILVLQLCVGDGGVIVNKQIAINEDGMQNIQPAQQKSMRSIIPITTHKQENMFLVCQFPADFPSALYFL